VITVGAVDENGTDDTSDDTIADWSSRGTTQDGLQKPDVYAPGAHIVSVLAPDSVFADECSSCIIGGWYIKWTPDQVKGALLSPDVRSSTTLAEVSAASLAGLSSPPLADQSLTPNALVGSGGAIDYSLSRLSTAPATLSAEFAKSSYICSCLTSGPGSTDPSLSRWSMSSWSTFPVTADSK
jgi:serine protease AprX